MSRSGVSLCGAVCAAGIIVAGCSGPATEGSADSKPVHRAEPGLFEPRDEPDVPAITVKRAPFNAVLPDNFGSSIPGLEILSWETIDPGGRVLGVIEGFDRLPEAEAQQLARWSRSGIEVRLIDLDELNDLLTQLPPVASLKHRAWGSILQWQPAITARQSSQRLQIYDGVIDLDPGSTPRVLMRGWVEPAISGGVASPRVRAELVPQWYKAKRSAFESVATLSRVVENGLVLEELVLSMQLEPGTALILTAGSRDRIAGETENKAEPARDTGSESGDGGVGGVGPPVPLPPTLGSVLFRVERARGRTHDGAAGLLSKNQAAEVTVLVLVPVVDP